MRALILEADSYDILDLPVAYQHLVQGLFYSVWNETEPCLHDEGYGSPVRGLRLFTFSPIRGRYRLEDGRILFTSPIRLELRSAKNALVDDVAAALTAARSFRLGRNELQLISAKTEEQFLFPEKAWIRMRSPLSVYETLPDRKTHYFTPEDEEWEARIYANLCEKMHALFLPEPEVFHITPEPSSLKKRVTHFKETHITGYTGEFLLETTPEAMKVLYYTGIGSRGSQGCGMFDLIG